MKSLFFASILIIILGAGCDKEQPAPQSLPTISDKVHREPIGVDPLELAFDFCEAGRYQIVAQYDEAKDSNIYFCQFQSGYACEALAFRSGLCHVSSTNRIFLDTTDIALQNVRECSEEEQPVCDEDGNTYTNSCIAAIQKVAVAHAGACTKEEQQKTAPLLSESAVGVPISGGPTALKQPSGPAPTSVPPWAQILFNISGAKTLGGPALVFDYCTNPDGKPYYYVEERCPNCFSTLYTVAGAVVCHPHQNIKNECPSWFSLNTKKQYCVKLK